MHHQTLASVLEVTLEGAQIKLRPVYDMLRIVSQLIRTTRKHQQVLVHQSAL